MTEINKSKRYWIGVACKEHVKNGIKLGICQFCHGKSTPANRPNKGDYIIYYSSKLHFQENTVCQQFTAIGKILNDKAYPVDMGEGFKPFRRDVKYLRAKDIDIRPLIDYLPFIKNKRSWGYTFRYGFLEIDQASFEIIAKNMLGRIPT